MIKQNWEVFGTFLVVAAVILLAAGFAGQATAPAVIEISDPLPAFQPILFWVGWAWGGASSVVAVLVGLRWFEPYTNQEQEAR